ncbi:MAG: hypothetical protein J1E37_00240 [Prevotella sp.]|nr:hypothetical protein [Prevotella sp.]
MKKTYINPEMEIIKVATTQMLAVSVGTNSDPIVDSNDVGARGFGDDDDDWE